MIKLPKGWNQQRFEQWSEHIVNRVKAVRFIMSNWKEDWIQDKIDEYRSCFPLDQKALKELSTFLITNNGTSAAHLFKYKGGFREFRDDILAPTAHHLAHSWSAYAIYQIEAEIERGDRPRCKVNPFELMLMCKKERILCLGAIGVQALGVHGEFGDENTTITRSQIAKLVHLTVKSIKPDKIQEWKHAIAVPASGRRAEQYDLGKIRDTLIRQFPDHADAIRQFEG